MIDPIALVLVVMVFVGIVSGIGDILDLCFQRWCCHKADFDCDFCRYWMCPAHRCRREREKRQLNDVTQEHETVAPIDGAAEE